MSLHVHVYLQDIYMQLAVVFIANTSNESSNESAHLCSLNRAFATCIQYSQPFSYILALRLCSHLLNVSQYDGIEMCLHRSTFLCHGECHLITQSSQLHSIKELLFQLRYYRHYGDEHWSNSKDTVY